MNNLKPKQYAGCCNNNPDHQLFAEHSNRQTFESKKETFSDREREVYKILSKNTSASLWGDVIRATINKGSVPEFRKLIDQLHEQGNDAPDVMIKIIGRDGFDAVRNCKEFV